ncbi:AlpA family transcriptional regulator [Pseudomonadales bacterium]|nr:AlpA family transcriptional regulator [Pseudomonadales bacterium]
MASSPQQLQLFIRLPAVLQKVGMSKSFVYDLITQDKFPKPVKVSPRISCWVAAEVDQWVQDRIDARD